MADRNSPRSRICPAIQSRRAVQFWYGLERRERFCIVEPYLYGLLHDEEETLLCYQVSGHGGIDVPVGWKIYRPSLMLDLLVTDDRFSGRRAREGFDERRALYATIVCQMAPESPAVEVPQLAAPVVAALPLPPPAAPPPRPRSHFDLMKRFRHGHWFPF